jgi:hypothetical protein
MLKRVKRWLGIEGVKLELVVPEEISERQEQLTGSIRLHSLENQQVSLIRIILIERYARGRGKDKLVDEYKLGEINIERLIDVPANGTVELDFTLPFSVVRSQMDEWGQKNPLNKGLSKAVKWFEGVKSHYRVEAEAKVKGVALNPFDKQEVKIA